MAKGRAPASELRGRGHLLNVRADAASWVNIEVLRLYLNGRLWREVELRKSLPYSEMVHVRRGSVLVVEVPCNATSLYQTVLPGFTPLALANPLIDADADGRWLPPGGALIPAEGLQVFEVATRRERCAKLRYSAQIA